MAAPGRWTPSPSLLLELLLEPLDELVLLLDEAVLSSDIVQVRVLRPRQGWLDGGTELLLVLTFHPAWQLICHLAWCALCYGGAALEAEHCEEKAFSALLTAILTGP